MKIRLLCVGRPKQREAIGLHDRYAERLKRLGVTYSTAWVPDVAGGGRFSDEHVRQREARALLERLGRGSARDRLIALDPGGELLTSELLARRLERWATPSACFVVGGPLGLGAELVERAEFVWSLSRLTFPHELVRVLVVEQLYRGVTQSRGLPYHK